MIDFLLGLLFVCQSFALFTSFWSTMQICEHIVSIMKVFAKRNNLQVEFIRFLKKKFGFIPVFFCKATDSMQYRSPNAHLDSGCQTMSNNYCQWRQSHLADFVGHLIWCAVMCISTVYLHYDFNVDCDCGHNKRYSVGHPIMLLPYRCR